MLSINKKYFSQALALFCAVGFLSVYSAKAEAQMPKEESVKSLMMKVEGSQVPYSITYDSSKWKLLGEKGEYVEYAFAGTNGITNAFIVAEKSSFPMDQMAIFLQQTATVRAGLDDVLIDDHKIIKVDGRDVHYFELSGIERRSKRPIVLFFYTYSDSEHTIQFGARTNSRNPGAGLKGDILELLDGLSFNK